MDFFTTSVPPHPTQGIEGARDCRTPSRMEKFHEKSYFFGLILFIQFGCILWIVSLHLLPKAEVSGKPFGFEVGIWGSQPPWVFFFARGAREIIRGLSGQPHIENVEKCGNRKP